MRFDASGCLGFRSVLSGRSSGPSDTEKLEGVRQAIEIAMCAVSLIVYAVIPLNL